MFRFTCVASEYGWWTQSLIFAVVWVNKIADRTNFNNEKKRYLIEIDQYVAKRAKARKLFLLTWNTTYIVCFFWWPLHVHGQVNCFWLHMKPKKMLICCCCYCLRLFIYLCSVYPFDRVKHQTESPKIYDGPTRTVWRWRRLHISMTTKRLC